jgi:glycosyltransferase involved in cell wall biosynthesis
MGKQRPFFSVIIPTKGRQRQLKACLQAFVRTEYALDRFEVIVVDDGSKIPLNALIDGFRRNIDVVLVAQPHSGPAAARNTGARLARGNYLAFTDDDCMPKPDWLEKLALRFNETPKHLVGGHTANAVAHNPYSSASQMLIDYLYSQYNVVADDARFLTSNNLAVPAAEFHALGGFDASFPLAAAEDRDFCDRWRHHGLGMIYAPEVLVYHAHVLTFLRFLRQHFRYGRGAFSFHRARTQRGQKPIRLEPASFYTDLLRYPFLQAQRRTAFLPAVLLFLSQMANATGFFWELGVNYNWDTLCRLRAILR